MNIEEIRDFCLKKNGVEEALPFDEDTLVFKVGGKMFLLAGISSRPLQFNAKCDPDKAEELRENYTCVLPGYHMNKKHWNTIICDGSAGKKIVFGWIEDSYKLVVDALPKKIKQELLKP